MAETISRSIFGTAKKILFYVIIAFLSVFILFEIFLPKQTVKVFGFKPYHVMTQSMEPVLNVNDFIIVTNFDAEDLQEGDIITFYADIDYNGEKEIVTHYIHSINEDTSGDLLFRTHRHYEDDEDVTADPWVLSEDDILGEYAFRIPFLGYVTDFLRSPFGIAAIIVNVGVITAVVILIKREKNEKSAGEKEKEE